MFLSLTDFFNDEPALIAADNSSVNIDVSEFEKQEDKEFLVAHGQEILRIDAKATAAKERICKVIDERAEDAKGRHIYEIQERFKSTPELKGGLMRFFHSLGFWDSGMSKMGLDKPEKYTGLNTAFNWANAYRASLEMNEKLAGLLSPEELQERIHSLPAGTLGKLYSGLSTADREVLYLGVVDGKFPGQVEAKELVRSPEAKLSKAEELLEAAKARKEAAEERWEEVKADPNIPCQVDGMHNPEYKAAQAAVRNTSNSVANFERQIAELQQQVAERQAQIEEEKLRTAQEHEEKARLETELQKLKFDDATARAERVKRISNNLTLSVPQTLADVQKFFAEKDEYPEKIRKHLLEQLTLFANYVGDQL